MTNPHRLVAALVVGFVVLAGMSGTVTSATVQQSMTEDVAERTNHDAVQIDMTPQSADGNQGEEWTVTIIRVIDGDTVEARFPNGEVDTLRLLGVDTPETTLSRIDPDEFEGIPNTTAGRDHLFNWGKNATNYTNDTLHGETVQIRVDPQADRRGSYGRLLVYIYDDSVNFTKQLLSEGYDRMYDSQFSLREEFETAESNARENSTGLWNFTTAQTADPETAEDESSVSLPPRPADGDYDCSHFDSHRQAQAVLERESGDPHRLDADDDGIACESLG